MFRVLKIHLHSSTDSYFSTIFSPSCCLYSPLITFFLLFFLDYFASFCSFLLSCSLVFIPQPATLTSPVPHTHSQLQPPLIGHSLFIPCFSPLLCIHVSLFFVFVRIKLSFIWSYLVCLTL